MTIIETSSLVVEIATVPRGARSAKEVGATGFEPATARPPAECATRLRHAPKRATGLEPAPRAWKALVRPLHHARGGRSVYGLILHGRPERLGALLRRRRVHPHDLPAVAVEVEEAA